MRSKRFIAAAAAVGLLIGVPTAGAAGVSMITGKDVKNGSIMKRDLSAGVQKNLKKRAVNGVNGATGATGATGAKGATGATGIAGKNGVNGKDGAVGPMGPQGPEGADSTVPGPNGESAYELAVANGYEGTLDEWMDSLKGDEGVRGPVGPAGSEGTPGKDSTVEGPRGPQGDVGPVGPAGASGSIAGYEIVAPTGDNEACNTKGHNNQTGQIESWNKCRISSSNNGTFYATTITCPAGKTAIGGGVKRTPSDVGHTQSNMHLNGSSPALINENNTSASAWEIEFYFHDYNNADVEAQAYAICVSGS